MGVVEGQEDAEVDRLVVMSSSCSASSDDH
jgi:hypothetical protein